MRIRTVSVFVVGVLLLVLAVDAPTLAVNIETVSVGNPGNAGDDDPDRDGYGGVDYEYNIGKYEVTVGQYTEFLNAVAATDTYGLYHSYMGRPSLGYNLLQSGSSGSYTYSVAPDWADQPVAYVSWADAARFCNWLENGQPVGRQSLSTTEDGSYYLDGAMYASDMQTVTRDPDATWVVPTRDEWCKAAYHKNDGVTGNYFDYPMSSDSLPSNLLIDPDPGNNATFKDGEYTLDFPYRRTDVGAHENSESPYGTFDQGGNVWEWYDVVLSSRYRFWRGGGYSSYRNDLHSGGHGSSSLGESGNTGFRVVMVPEPATLALLAFGGVGMLARRKGLG